MSTLLPSALASYGLEGAEAMFLQHNENLTYRVDNRYLLRIHTPAKGIYAPATTGDRQIELAFLRHLHSRGMPVQLPIPDRQGSMVTLLPDGSAATLLCWLPGQTLSGMEQTEELCTSVGEMTARLHHASRGFAAPGIRAYDAAQCRHTGEILAAMVQRHHLGDEHTAILRQACQAVGECFSSSADQPLVIHDDLSPSNILLTASGLVPIDFSLCGLGLPMTDVGMLLAGFSSALGRKSIVRGYAAAGGVVRHRELEAGFLHGLLCALVFHADTWPQEPWFPQRLRRWEQEEILPFCEGRPFLDGDMKLIYLPERS